MHQGALTFSWLDWIRHSRKEFGPPMKTQNKEASNTWNRIWYLGWIWLPPKGAILGAQANRTSHRVRSGEEPPNTCRTDVGIMETRKTWDVSKTTFSVTIWVIFSLNHDSVKDKLSLLFPFCDITVAHMTTEPTDWSPSISRRLCTLLHQQVNTECDGISGPQCQRFKWKTPFVPHLKGRVICGVYFTIYRQIISQVMRKFTRND